MTGAALLRLAAGSILFVAGLLYILFALAAFFLRYGLPPCESDTPVFWALGGSGAGLLAGAGVIAFARLPALTRIALAVGILAIMFTVQHLVIADNDTQQAACAARSLPEAIASCGGVPSHYRSGTTAEGYTTLTLVAPGTTDRAWNCLHRWAIHADGAPSLVIDESVYVAYRAQTEAARGAPSPR